MTNSCATRRNGIEHARTRSPGRKFSRGSISSRRITASVVAQIQRCCRGLLFFTTPVMISPCSHGTDPTTIARSASRPSADNLFCRLGSGTVKGNGLNLIFNVIASSGSHLHNVRLQGDFGRLGDLSTTNQRRKVSNHRFWIDLYANVDFFVHIFSLLLSPARFPMLRKSSREGSALFIDTASLRQNFFVHRGTFTSSD